LAARKSWLDRRMAILRAFSAAGQWDAFLLGDREFERFHGAFPELMKTHLAALKASLELHRQAGEERLQAGEYGNASSIHTFGQRARAAVETARERIYEYCLPLEDARAYAAYGQNSFVGKILEIHQEMPGRIHVVLIREGLMFATDPAAAAREVRRVLRPGGRAVIAVWAARERNPWLGLVFEAVSAQVGKPVPPPGVPTPFSLGAPGQVESLLVDAGFSGVQVEEAPTPLRAGILTRRPADASKNMTGVRRRRSVARRAVD